MAIFQTWVFCLQDYDIEEIVSYPRGKRKESKAEERVERQAGFLLLVSAPRFLNCPLGTGDLAAYSISTHADPPASSSAI